MIHLAEDRDVHVAQIPRKQPGHDLTASIGQHLVAAGETGENDLDVVRPVVFPDEVLGDADRPNLADQPIQGVSIIVRKVGSNLQFPDKRLQHPPLRK
jgi:hypothetical protein